MTRSCHIGFSSRGSTASTPPGPPSYMERCCSRTLWVRRRFGTAVPALLPTWALQLAEKLGKRVRFKGMTSSRALLILSFRAARSRACAARLVLSEVEGASEESALSVFPANCLPLEIASFLPGTSVQYNMLGWAIDRRYIRLYCSHPGDDFSPSSLRPDCQVRSLDKQSSRHHVRPR